MCQVLIDGLELHSPRSKFLCEWMKTDGHNGEPIWCHGSSSTEGLGLDSLPLKPSSTHWQNLETIFRLFYESTGDTLTDTHT